MPQLWWRDHLALSVPWGIWAFSEWAVRYPSCYHPNHMEHTFHSWQSLDPLEMSPLHIEGWGQPKERLDGQGKLLILPTYGSNNNGSWDLLSIACLPLGFWGKSWLPHCLSQITVSLGVTKLYMASTITIIHLHRRIWLKKKMLCFPGLPLLSSSFFSRYYLFWEREGRESEHDQEGGALLSSWCQQPSSKITLTWSELGQVW